MQDQSKTPGLELLTNQELYMIYTRFKKHQVKISESIERRVVPVSVNTPFGPATMMKPVNPEEIEKMRNSSYMKTVNGIVEKLTDFCELIKDVDPEVMAITSEFE